MTENEEVVFTALVTDPDGIDDLIGGSLIDPNTGATYGAFATAAMEGAYSLTLHWSDLHQVQAIDFNEEVARTFQADFFDQAGHMASVSITLTLHCGGFGACDSVCTNLTTTTNCGSCGTLCEDAQTCEEGACQCLAPRLQCEDGCIDPIVDNNNCGTCGNVCRNDQTCVEGQCQCEGREIDCDGVCVNPLQDRDNCGRCGNVCGPGLGCYTHLGGSCHCFMDEESCVDDGFCASFTFGNNTYGVCVDHRQTRLVSGDTAHEGFLQMKFNEGWLFVCPADDNLGQVACRDAAANNIGDGTHVSTMSRAHGDATSEYYNINSVDRISCTGDEETLEQCANIEFAHGCSEGPSAYVVCGAIP